MNTTEQDERNWIVQVQEMIDAAMSRIDENIIDFAEQLRENKVYLYENKAEMDNFERYGMRMAIARGARSGENAVEQKKKLLKLRVSPFFGRIDFKETKPRKSKEALSIYIGTHSFIDTDTRKSIIFDWRAPVSSLYYDHEPGIVSFKSPSGKITGDMSLKRQYRIVNGNLDFMLDTALNILDDILQKELSQTSDERMKNIVSTIQRDQNAIIRNEKAEALIIQGVAGSGKTSVAMHRIAFLLYRFKDELKSDEIMIISPNKVFSDYISGVLPELGEENIPARGMEEIAAELLEHKIKFQTFYQQVQYLLENNDPAFEERIRFKSSEELIHKLNSYLVNIENNSFVATDIWVKRFLVPAWFIEERFKSLHRLNVQKRIPQIIKDIEENIRIYYNYDISTEERGEIRKKLGGMLKHSTLRDYYKGFYDWMERPDLYASTTGKLEYCDVFPLIYLKHKLEGIKRFEKIRHLIIDEMQDYNYVQYAVISQVFPCRKTILGDINQSVNPFSSADASSIKKAFPGSDYVKLTKSYRSSWEITEFAKKILASPEMTAMRRHGEKPILAGFESPNDQTAAILAEMTSFRESGHKSMGIICKSEKHAKAFFAAISKSKIPASLIKEDTEVFAAGVVVCPVNLAKGLEFDIVIVPDADNKNYQSNYDRNLLYVACTRAMHKLILTYTGEVTELVEG